MRAWAVAAVVWLASGVAWAGERVEVPEGWYQTEEGSGEAPGGELIVIAAPAAEDRAAAEPTPEERQAERAPTVPTAEGAPSQARDACAEVRGRYLARVLELHGVDVFGLDPGALAVWTRRRPPAEGGPWWLASSLGDPALALLYGEPPVPGGALSYDFTLQNLAKELLRCDSGGTPGIQLPEPPVEQRPAAPAPEP